MSESYLDSIISSDDSSLSLDGYNFIRADHHRMIKKGEVCIYYRETLSVKTIQINYLSECQVCEINYGNKKVFIVTLYRSPSQTGDEFDEFLCSFERVIDNIIQANPYFVVITRDFHIRSSNWLGNDMNNFEAISIKHLISSDSLKPLISEANHLLTSSSCINLILTNQPNISTLYSLIWL